MATERLMMAHLKQYAPTVCWLRTKNGDEYVGVYFGMNSFNGDGNLKNGVLNLRELVTVGRTGKPRKLHAFGEPRTISFNVDHCKISAGRGTHSKITTAQGDQIFLSRELYETRLVLGLIKARKEEILHEHAH